MKWRLDFWKADYSDTSAVTKELDRELKSNTQAQIVFLAMVTVLQQLGPREFISAKNKHLGRGLFELRDLKNGKRYYYTETSFIGKSEKEEQIILLLGAVGNKNTVGEQNRDIEKACKRLCNICKDNIFADDLIEIMEK